MLATDAGSGGTGAPAGERSERTIPETLSATATSTPGEPFLVDAGRTCSYGELLEAAELAARRLANLGIGAGDRVVLWLPNGIDWASLFFGVMSLGGIVVPAGSRLRSTDLRHVLADSGARALVYTPRFLGIDFDRMVAELLRLGSAGELPKLELALAVEGERPPSGSAVRLLDVAPAEELPEHDPDPSAPAIACYTSGSTGRPKGCLHSHRTLVRNGEIAAGLTGLGRGERTVCPVPFAHIFGFHMGVLQTAISGATLINAEPFAAARCLDLAESERGTVLYAVPTMARELSAEQIREPRRLSLRLALVAGAPVSPGLRRTLLREAQLADGISVVYGCTEAPTIAQQVSADADAEGEGSVGRPTPGLSVRIARPGTTEELERGELGEILVRGYNHMLGYLGDPDGTAAKFRDGWLVTGDLGRVDRAGFLYFGGRADETLLVGGFNAYPREIEAQLEGMDGLREAAVIGVPDERLGQVPMAWVTGSPDLDDASVMSWAQRNLASYKRPRYIRVVAAIPRLGSGKIARVQLLEQARRSLPALPWEATR